MAGFSPFAVYGLKVPTGGIIVPVSVEHPSTIRITMAAIDPTLAPEADEEGNIPNVPRSTLKILKAPYDPDEEDDEDDEDVDEYLQSLIANASDDEEDDDEEEEEEANGGPSDPAKSKRARQEAALRKLLQAAENEEDSDDDMEDAGAKTNGSKKGKEKASDDDEDESDEDDEEDLDSLDFEEFVVCTLDTERTYQQPLDITIGEGEKVFFVATGTHPIHLMGNIMQDDHDLYDDSDEDDEDDDYDLPPDMDLLDEDDEDMSDDLDPIKGAKRVKEIDTDDEDDEEAPKLVPVKGKNKRPAEEEPEGLDEMIAKDEAKLSKKQLKKLKNNKGEAVAAEEKAAAKESPAGSKGDKKVQFAKNLEQGPTGPAKKAAGNVKVVQGVTIDDRKIGTGRTVKSGDKVGMRYIGKLQDGKIFDSNKKGPAFAFKVGKGEVIKGWDIGIVGMAVGGERRLTIPAHLAYGSKGVPGIPGNSTLIFDVKLLEIK